MPDGSVGIICGGRHRRLPPCVHCGEKSAFECDGPAPAGAKRKTCDAALCRRCRIHVPPDRDYCRGHREDAKAAAAQLRMQFHQEEP